MVIRSNIGSSFVANIQQCLAPSLADTNMVDLIAIAAIRRVPRNFVAILVRKERATNHQVVTAAYVNEQFTILIPYSKSMLAHNMFHIIIGTSYFGVEISH
jgi:hypothetical protein